MFCRLSTFPHPGSPQQKLHAPTTSFHLRAHNYTGRQEKQHFKGSIKYESHKVSKLLRSSLTNC